MPVSPNVLVLVEDPVNRRRILNEFKKQKFRLDVVTVQNEEEIFKVLNYDEQNQSFVKVPDIMLLDGNIRLDSILKIVRKDPRFCNTSVYILINEGRGEHEKSNHIGFRISGFVDNTFEFNDYSSENYLDLVGLQIKILKIGLQIHHNLNQSR